MDSISDTNNDTQNRWTTAAILALIMLVGAVLRVWGIGFGLPATLARPDENIVLEIAATVTAGEFNPKFFTYPTGYIYLLGALFHITVPLFTPPYPIDPSWDLSTLYTVWQEPFYLTGRWVVVVMGVVSLWLLYVIGKRIGGRNLGLLTAWFFAVAPIPVRHAHFTTSDFPMVFFCLVTMVFVLRRVQGGGVWDSLLAGLFGGLAAAMKYPGALMAVPILLAHIRWKPLRLHQHVWLSGMVMAGVFLLLNPFIFVEWGTFKAHFAYEAAHLMAPHEGIDLGRGWFYHPWVTFPIAMGMPVYLAAVAGLIWWAVKGGRERWIIIITLLLYLLVLGRGKAVFFRYLDAVFPFLAVLAAGFVVEITSKLPWKRSSQVIAVAVLGILLALPAIARSIQIDRLLSRTDTRVQAGEWLTEHLEPDTEVFLSGYFGMPQLVPHFLKYQKITNWREAQFMEQYQRAIAEAPEWNRHPLEIVTPEDIFLDLDKVVLMEGMIRDSLRAWEIDWVVMDRYFLPYYSDYPVGLPEALRTDFDLIVTFSCLKPDAKPMPMFELQDAFFLPVARFHGIERPGPEIKIYKRKATDN